jgi:hypothetical protein
VAVASTSLLDLAIYSFADVDRLVGLPPGRLGVGSTGIGVRVLIIRRCFGVSTPVART